MKEQQSGLGPKTDRHDARKLPSLPSLTQRQLQQQLIADAHRHHRQAAYEAEYETEAETYEAEEADPSYGGHFAGLHPEHRPSQSGPLAPMSTGSRTHPRASVLVDAQGTYELEEDKRYDTTRLPSSTRRYQLSPEHVFQQGNRRYHVGSVEVPRRASKQAQLLPPRHQRRRDHD